MYCTDRHFLPSVFPWEYQRQFTHEAFGPGRPPLIGSPAAKSPGKRGRFPRLILNPCGTPGQGEESRREGWGKRNPENTEE